MQTQKLTQQDAKLDAMQAVTQRLGFRHWLWRTDPAVADEPIHGGKVRMVLPQLWGWVNDGIDGARLMTEARDFTATVRADNLGEAVSAFEVAVIAHLQKQDATERERWIEGLEWSQDRKEIRVVWGS